MSFELTDLNTVVDQIESYWEKIGLSLEERNAEKKALDHDVMRVFLDFRQTLDKKCRMIDNQINEVIENHIKLLKKFADTSEQINELINNGESVNESLNIRLAKAQDSYEKDRIKYKELLDSINHYKNEGKKLFDILQRSAEEKESFNSLLNVYSNDNLTKIKAIVDEMNSDLKIRKEKILELNNFVATLSEELEVEITNDVVTVFVTNSLSDQSIYTVSSFVDQLNQIKKERLEKVTLMANEITRLWNILGVKEEERQNFLRAHSTLGESVLASCEKEIKRLNDQWHENIPHLIKQQNMQIFDLCSTLGQIRPEKEQITDLENTYIENENELKHLLELQKIISPYLNDIKQREDILFNVDALSSETSKSPKDEQQLRRYRSLLPRLEKKLLMQMIEFKEIYGFDLEWEGKSYISTLEHIKLSKTERSQAKTKGRKRSLNVKSLVGNQKMIQTHRKSENCCFTSNLQ